MSENEVTKRKQEGKKTGEISFEKLYCPFSDTKIVVNTRNGIVLKNMVDIASCCNGSSIPIKFEKEGFYMYAKDTSDIICTEIFMDAEDMVEYHCPKTFVISLDITHFLGLLSNVRAKMSLILYVRKSNPNKFGVSIPSKTADKDSSVENTIIETSWIQCTTNVPYQNEDITLEDYEKPVSITAEGFSRIKSLLKMTKSTVNVKVQRNYLCISNEGNDAYQMEIRKGLPKKGPIFDEGISKNAMTTAVKLCKVADNIKFYMPLRESYPLRISCKLDSVDKIPKSICAMYINPENVLNLNQTDS